MSGEYWGRPTDQQPDDNQNPDTVNNNVPPFAPPAPPQGDGSTESWSAPTYGSAPSPQVTPTPSGAEPVTPETATYGAAPVEPGNSSGFEGPSYSAPSYTTPTYGAPAYGSSADPVSSTSPDQSGAEASYQPTSETSTSDPGSATSWSATDLNLDAPTPDAQPGGYPPVGQPYGNAGSGYGQETSRGYGTAGANGLTSDPDPSYGQPASAQGYPGGYAQPTPGYASQSYASPGYATPATPPIGSYSSTPQDTYASTGTYGYGAVLSGPVAPNGRPYANFGKRVLSYLVDFAAPVIVYEVVVGIAAASGSDTLAGVASTIMGIASLAWFIYNTVYLGGTTGQSWGRKIAGTRLLSEATGRPLGMGMAFVRQLAHIIDYAICLIGYLFPLWDAKRQTIADKIVSSVVIDEGTN